MAIHLAIRKLLWEVDAIISFFLPFTLDFIYRHLQKNETL